MIMLVGSVMMAGMSLFFTLFLQSVRGLTPLETGLWMVISAVALVAGSMTAPTLAQKIRPGVVIAISLVGAVAGFLLIVAIAIVSLSAGGFASLSTGLAVSSVPPEQAGSASSVSATSGELGVALGIAVIGTVGTSVYRGLLDVPAGVPESTAETARENITGAVAAVVELPGATGAALLDAARDAFTTALQTVAGISAVIATVLAVVAVTVLRQFPPTGETPDAAADGDGAVGPAEPREARAQV